MADVQEHIAVIGDGGMGTICAIMLAENGYPVQLWSAFPQQAADLHAHRENRRFLPGASFPESLHVTADAAEAFAGATWILSAVPTQFSREVWTRLAPSLPAGVPICSVTKGVEVETQRRPTQVLSDVLGKDQPLAVLSGPSIAPEIAEKLPATVIVACKDAAVASRIQACMTRPYFRVYTSEDVVGVELAGATKNVIAIAAGILDGLRFGDNAKAALLARGIAEIARLGVAAGARAETFFGVSGVGDLVTTCISPMGRNRSFGEDIGLGKSLDEALAAREGVVEGVATTNGVLALARHLGVDMPITAAVHAVLFEGKNPRDAIAELMTRPLRAE